ncbi:formimidoylglutamate deiminase [Chachezhania sediminis]|uniref:formimidoylglutamate deiminase n=1 Tax=Chachezhania sediminis TaxID=2599291 RepID=UPI00131D7E4F|nr:formimidoylglutamate deiminase [Chachezhania sediminis]
MLKIRAGQALLPEGWARDVTVHVVDGRIAAVEAGGPDAGISQAVDVLLPAPANLHSHAFQRAMSGLTEARGPDATDSFWTWRRLMFRFLDRLTPDQVQAITAFVQMEMLEAGYGASVEFHYLHHQPGGVPYANVAEMSERVAAAAAETGIGLTLLPVLYQVGGCDGRPLGPGQVRFGCDLDLYAQVVEGARKALAGLPDDANLGIAPHSLRAVSRDAFPDLPGLGVDGPVHMHLAEQVAEVEEIEAAYGARPVDWAMEHLGLDPRWCLIHCTQMTPSETLSLAASGAVAGLCPITESNLGDGIFDGVRYLEAGGRIGVGSDSNLRISLSEEIRVLDHSQRLRDKGRAMLATAEKSTARRIFDEIGQGGAQAAGRDCGQIAVGAQADLLALDTDHVDLDGLHGDTLLDAYVFAADDRRVAEVWSAGRHVVTGGRHVRHDAITAGYRAALKGLRDTL